MWFFFDSAVDLNTMELQESADRLVVAIRNAKTYLGVPVLISAESVADPKTKDNLVAAYLLAFRTCALSNLVTPPSAPDAPKDGKFSTLRSGSAKSRLQTFRFAPEHRDLKCPVCEEGLDKRGLLVKVFF